MQILVVFVVLMFSAALLVYALPLILYIAPLCIAGIIISLAHEAVEHKSRPVGH
jgi:4-hydroxybenzoate polyprenyltransferase